MRTPSQRGRVGNWLRDQRLSRGWTTQAKARKQLALAGLPVAASVYAEWESGTRLPSENVLAKLVEYYGPLTDEPLLAADQAALVATIAAQTAAISDLVAELRRVADGQLGMSNALGQLAALALGSRLPPEVPSETPPQPRAGGRRSGAALR